MLAQKQIPQLQRLELLKGYVGGEQAEKIGQQAILLHMLTEESIDHKLHSVENPIMAVHLGRIAAEAAAGYFKIEQEDLQDLFAFHEQVAEDGHKTDLLSVRVLHAGGDHSLSERSPGTHITLNCFEQSNLLVQESPREPFVYIDSLEPGDAYITYDPVWNKPITHLQNMSDIQENVSITLH